MLQKGIHIRLGVDKLLHRSLCLDDKQFPVATDIFNTSISIPFYPSLKPEEVSTIANAIGRL